MTKIEKYIREIRRIKIKDAAKEIGRTYLNSIVTGRVVPGKKAAQKIEKWSNGWITAKDIIFPPDK